MRIIFLFLIFFGSLISTSGQELNCKINLNYSQLPVNSSGNREMFSELERVINEFMNGKKWSNDLFGPKEKIKCNLNINLLKSNGQFSYSGNAQFQVVRPVHGSSYESVILNFIDRDFDFNFAPENRQMLFNEQAFTSNLTSILAFYALTALAIDYDSFSKMGGNEFIDRMFNLTNLASNAVGGAWNSNTDTRNRYWIMENLRNQQFAVFRDGFYKYHRLGLDFLTTKPADGRKNMKSFLENLQNLNELRPNATMINLFFDAKSEEIVNVFSDADKKDKEEIYKICSKINPDKTEIYAYLLR